MQQENETNSAEEQKDEAADRQSDTSATDDSGDEGSDKEEVDKAA